LDWIERLSAPCAVPRSFQPKRMAGFPSGEGLINSHQIQIRDSSITGKIRVSSSIEKAVLYLVNKLQSREREFGTYNDIYIPKELAWNQPGRTVRGHDSRTQKVKRPERVSSLRTWINSM
jgi:hypothetical protein